MPTQADFDQAIDTLMQSITDAANRVAADISALKAQIDAGTPITPADLDKIQQAVTAIGAIDPPPSP